MSPSQDFLIVALDYYSLDKVESLVEELGDSVNFYKVGMQLFFSQGVKAIEYLQKKNKKIFLDLKLNDIPNTLEKATGAFTGFQGIHYFTVFTGEDGVKAAVTGCNDQIKILNVSVLTSQKDSSSQPVAEQVRQRVALTRQAGGHGIICSGHETANVRALAGDQFIIVNPGIRPAGVATQDQARVVTPRQALDRGASNIVVGRPITLADDPAASAKAILASLG